eukprot:432176-Rhodomonas_salina.2
MTIHWGPRRAAAPLHLTHEPLGTLVFGLPRAQLSSHWQRLSLAGANALRQDTAGTGSCTRTIYMTVLVLRDMNEAAFTGADLRDSTRVVVVLLLVPTGVVFLWTK